MVNKTPEPIWFNADAVTIGLQPPSEDHETDTPRCAIVIADAADQVKIFGTTAELEILAHGIREQIRKIRLYERRVDRAMKQLSDG
jgi:hypothetical protein